MDAYRRFIAYSWDLVGPDELQVDLSSQRESGRGAVLGLGAVGLSALWFVIAPGEVVRRVENSASPLGTRNSKVWKGEKKEGRK